MDFITVDDGGELGYAPSAQAVERDNEYPGELVCALDRGGTNHRLRRQADGSLMLCAAPSDVDMAWLRSCWASALALRPSRYPLRRSLVGSASDAQFLAMLFEVLQLGSGGPVAHGTWAMALDGATLHPESLQAAGSLLLPLQRPEDARLRDPFGHTYVPTRVKKRRLGIATGSYLLYTEPVRRSAVLASD